MLQMKLDNGETIEIKGIRLSEDRRKVFLGFYSNEAAKAVDSFLKKAYSFYHLDHQLLSCRLLEDSFCWRLSTGECYIKFRSDDFDWLNFLSYAINEADKIYKKDVFVNALKHFDSADTKSLIGFPLDPFKQSALDVLFREWNINQIMLPNGHGALTKIKKMVKDIFNGDSVEL